MSRLAPVTTGQPTQGMGTVPNGKEIKPNFGGPESAAAVTRKHASPLEAQRAEAEAEAAKALLLEDLAGIEEPASALPPDASLPANSPRNHYAAQRFAAAATWLSLTATELEVRQHFRQIPVHTGLETLARMRKQCDLAAETLNNRIDDGNTERCSGCGKTLEEVRKTQFIMQGSEVDPATGVPMPYRYCGVQCVRERNREKMLPPDQRDKKRFDGQEEGDIR